MSHLIRYVLAAALIFSSSVCYADRVWNPNRIRFYEASTIRCSGRIISPGKSQDEVMDHCGEPARTARVHGGPYDVWIYQFGNYVYYLGFIDERLERIKRARCWKDNPDCQ